MATGHMWENGPHNDINTHVEDDQCCRSIHLQRKVWGCERFLIAAGHTCFQDLDDKRKPAHESESIQQVYNSWVRFFLFILMHLTRAMVAREHHKSVYNVMKQWIWWCLLDISLNRSYDIIHISVYRKKVHFHFDKNRAFWYIHNLIAEPPFNPVMQHKMCLLRQKNDKSLWFI